MLVMQLVLAGFVTHSHTGNNYLLVRKCSSAKLSMQSFNRIKLVAWTNELLCKLRCVDQRLITLPARYRFPKFNEKKPNELLNQLTKNFASISFYSLIDTSFDVIFIVM